MRPRRRKWTGGIVAASLAAHVAVLTVLALHAPRLRIPREVPGPPEAVIPVLIIPRTPPPRRAPGARPQPIRLHRRQQPYVPQETPVAPLVAPTVEASRRPRPRPGPASWSHRRPRTRSPSTPARRCAASWAAPTPACSASAARSARSARSAGRRGQDGGLPGHGIDADKAGGLAAAARRKEADYAYKRSAAPAAPGGRIGSTAEELGKSLGNDKPTAKVPF
jgi:hypothetical protein